MHGDDSSTVSYIDLLSSALGASLLLMLILSIQAKQQVHPLAPPLEQMAWIQVRIEGGRPDNVRLDDGTPIVVSALAVDAGDYVIEGPFNPPAPGGQLRFDVLPPDARDVVHRVAAWEEFNDLAELDQYGVKDPDIEDFCRDLQAERTTPGLLRDAVVKAWIAKVRGNPKIPALTVRRAERFHAAVSSSLANQGTGQARVRFRWSTPANGSTPAANGAWERTLDVGTTVMLKMGADGNWFEGPR